jgi:hypothetical protein
MRRVAVLAVLGCVAALSSGCGGYVVSFQEYGGTAIVSADGRKVIVGGFGAGSCGTTVRAVARESATRVALLLRVLTPRTNTCGNVGVAEGMVPSQKITLRAPLGGRKLVDGRTGRATPWISARLVLRPTRLPPGYRSPGLIPGGVLFRTRGQVSAGCTQIYESPTRATELSIIQTARELPRSITPIAGGHRIRVRGYLGHASRNVISWREHGLTDYIVMAGPDGPANTPQILLTTRQLIAIADSAPGRR